jgi:DNA helicase-2/ATP-dependent DNA helicase PcrA
MWLQRRVEDLDESQRQAVTTPSPQVLVLASAGAGKTLVLTHRLAWLVGHYPRAAFLAVTFTNKAADELRQRVEALLGDARRVWKSEHTWISTFHRFCVRILRRYGYRIGIPTDFVIADEYQQRRVFEECLRARGLDPKKAYAGAFRSFQRLRSEFAEPPPHLDEPWPAVWRDYLERLRQLRALDFDDLQYETIRLLEADSALRSYLAEYFHTVLVDEFQDTNPPQYRLFRLLRGPDAPFFVVGDQDQSIYGFRGARPDHFHDLLRDYPATEVIPLRYNYRSRAVIVRVAMEVIARDEHRLPHEVQALHQGGRILIYGAEDERDEARWVRRHIERIREASPDAQVAVLVRARSQLPALEQAFQGARFPYVVVGLRSWWDSPPIRVVLDYAAFCAHPEVDFYLEAVCNVPSRGIGPRALQRLREQAGERPLWTCLAEAVEAGDDRLPATWVRFYREMSEWIALREAVPPVEWVRRLTEFLQERGFGDARQRPAYVERWKELLQLLRDVKTWPEFIEQLSLRAPDDRLLEPSEQRAVLVMTVHAAKGLEFDYVFIPGVEDGLFPHFLAETPEEVREERRIFFVAITRARQEVFLSWSADRYNHRRSPSPFFGDMPLAELRVEGLSLRQWFPEAWQAASSVEALPPSPEEEGVRPGDLVEHAVYGRGIVRSVHGEGDRTKVRIWFFTGETREFVLRRAPIRVLRGRSRR